jgi:hypothetical protein
MFSGAEIVNWFFGLCFAASVGIAGFTLERMRINVNSMAPPDKRIGIGNLLVRSLRRPFAWENTIVGYSLQILDEHRRYCQSSRLPIVFIAASVGVIVSFICVVVSGAIVH